MNWVWVELVLERMNIFLNKLSHSFTILMALILQLFHWLIGMTDVSTISVQYVFAKRQI